MVTFSDFDLAIWREGDRYMAEVRGSPAGSSRRVPLIWPFRDAHHQLLLQLELAVTRAHGYRGLLMSNEEKTLREFGSEVFKAVFRGSQEISDLYSKSLSQVSGPDRALRLKLRVEPPELAVLPWEYVYDREGRDDFVCLEEKLPMVRFLEGEAAMDFQVEGPLRILGMIANPKPDSGIDPEKEKKRIRDVFANSAGDYEFQWVQGGTLGDLYQKLKEDSPWHVFHFIGHGGTESFKQDEVTTTVGYVLMHDGQGGSVQVYAKRLARVLRSSNLRLAIMNCCDSGRGAGVSSLGGTLVQQARIPTVVAMQFHISDDGATRFSDQFYRALIKGESVENALTQARNFILAGNESTMEWGIPVLFTRTDPSGVCIPGRQTKPPTERVQPMKPPPPAAAPGPTPLTDAEKALRRIWGAR